MISKLFESDDWFDFSSASDFFSLSSSDFLSLSVSVSPVSSSSSSSLKGSWVLRVGGGKEN